MIKEVLSFDDVLIVPQYSNIASRKDVDTSSFGLKTPIISSNMDTITGYVMATEMARLGAGACLHRFSTVQENINEFKKSPQSTTMVSIGIGEAELERAIWLFESGAMYFVVAFVQLVWLLDVDCPLLLLFWIVQDQKHRSLQMVVFVIVVILLRLLQQEHLLLW
jgi:hypothetical protein